MCAKRAVTDCEKVVLAKLAEAPKHLPKMEEDNQEWKAIYV